MTEEKNKALRSIFKGASIVFLGIIISKVFGLLFRVLVGRTLGPEEYGVIALMMAVFSVANTFGHMGLNRGVHRYVSFYRGENDEERMIGTVRSGYLMILIPAMIVSTSLFLLSPWLSVEIFDDERLIWPLRMVAIAMPFWGIAKISVAVTNAFEKMQYKVYMNKIWTNVSEVVLAFILIYLGYNYIGAAFAYAFGFISAAFLGIYFARKVFPNIFSPAKKGKYDIEELWSHSWPLFAAGIFGLITSHIDTFMIQYFEASESVGLYQAAYPFAALLLSGKAMFSKIVLSRASYLKSRSEKDLSETFRVVVKWISIVTIPIFLLLMAYPRSALILFGAEYYQAENVLRILLLGFLLSAIIGPANSIYQAVDMTRVITGLSILVAGINFVLNIILIPAYGITGAAVASAATFAIIFGVKLYFIYRILGKSPFRRSIFRIILAGLISMGIIVGISNILFATTPYWYLIPAFLGFALIYPVLVIGFRSLEDEDINILRAIQQKSPVNITPLIDIMEKYSR